MNKVEWEPYLKELTDLWQIYEEKICESADMSVVLSMDNSHSLDLDTIITEACSLYEDITNHSWHVPD